MISYCKRLSSFVDPYSIGMSFSKSTSISEILAHFQLQKPVFSLKDHGPMILTHISKLKFSGDFSKSHNDQRFKDLLSMINTEQSLDTYLDLLLQVSLIYKQTKTPLPEELKKGFNRRLIDNHKSLNLDNAVKSFQIISLVANSDDHFIKHATTISKSFLDLCEKKSPSGMDCLNIVKSLINL